MLKIYKFGYEIIDNICASIEWWIWILSFCIVCYLDDKKDKRKSSWELEREKEHQYFEMCKGRLDIHYGK